MSFNSLEFVFLFLPLFLGVLLRLPAVAPESGAGFWVVRCSTSLEHGTIPWWVVLLAVELC